MKRTRKSEAAETKVRILRLGRGRWGKKGCRKASRAEEECSAGAFLCLGQEGIQYRST